MTDRAMTGADEREFPAPTSSAFSPGGTLRAGGDGAAPGRTPTGDDDGPGFLQRTGELIARRRRWVAGTWLVLVLLAFGTALGGVTGDGLFARLSSGSPSVPGESHSGLDLLNRSTPNGPIVYLLADQVDPRSPQLAALVSQARSELVALPGVATVLDPYLVRGTVPDPRARAMVSTDGRAVLVAVAVREGLSSTDSSADEAGVSTHLDAVAARLRTAAPGSHVIVGGHTAIFHQITHQVRADLEIGEGIALPVSLALMIVVFGGFIAAGLPLVGAVAAIGGSLATLLGFSYAIDLDASVVNVVTVLCLGLCIDYGLLMVSRFREELRRTGVTAGQDPTQADVQACLGRTMASAGRTVAFSAVTVTISLAGLMTFQSSFLKAVGAAGVSAVLVALLVALTLVPACIALAGRRMARPGMLFRFALLRRFGEISPEHGAFSRLAGLVQRRPLLVALGVSALLLGAAVPALGIRLTSSGQQLLPVSAPQRQLFDALDQRFVGQNRAPITVVTHADPVQVTAWAGSVRALPGVLGVDAPQRQYSPETGQVVVLQVHPAGGAASDTARRVVREIRADRPGFRIWVTGSTPLLVDFIDAWQDRIPVAAGVVALATFVLLFLMTGSVLLPLKALLLNLVSLGACFGVLVWVFQWGHLEHLIGFTSVGAVETSIPALVLAFGFGLAMDYEVFLLSRVNEFHLAGLDSDAAVRQGLQRSGRIITSAALIVVVVFAGFTAGKLLVIKETGVALAAAVTIDATLVRMLLVPATMTLLGDWNWWAPGPLRRLHQRIPLRH